MIFHVFEIKVAFLYVQDVCKTKYNNHVLNEIELSSIHYLGPQSSANNYSSDKWKPMLSHLKVTKTRN